MPHFSVKGNAFLSTKDVAEIVDLAQDRLRALTSRGVLPDVDRQTHVTRKQHGFTEQWLRDASAILGKTLPDGVLTEQKGRSG